MNQVDPPRSRAGALIAAHALWLISVIAIATPSMAEDDLDFLLDLDSKYDLVGDDYLVDDDAVDRGRWDFGLPPAISAGLPPVNLMAAADAGGGGGEAAPADDEAAIAAAMLNPLSYLWLLFGQNDLISYDGTAMDAIGEGHQLQNSTLLMPVLSQQLTDDWKMIFRPVIPFNSFKSVDNVNVSLSSAPPITGAELSRETGLGDIVLWTAFSKQYTPPVIFGFGTTIMLDTASDDYLGTGKNSAGPMALLFKITDKWVNGVVAQHWWSFSGSDSLTVGTDVGPVTVDRPDVNLTDVQVVVRYRKSALTNIGMAPNWRYNWETRELSLPIGIGFDTMIKVGGKLPAKIGAEVYYYAVQDDKFGPKWQLRFLFIPVVPAPESSRRPLFGR